MAATSKKNAAEKRTRLEGLSALGSSRYKKVKPTVDQSNRKVWKPAAGTDLEHDSVITFNLVTNKNEIIKFDQDPFFLLFSGTVENKTHVATDLATTITGAKRHFLLPQDDAPGCYFEPTLSAQTFFSRVEVIVNGQPLEGPALDEFCFLYQRLNRTFTTDGVRKHQYGNALSLISNSAEREYTAKDKMSARLKEAMSTLQFDTAPSSKDMLASFSFDGFFPWNFQSNLCKAIFGPLENGFLPPGIELNLRLHKRSPLDIALERPRISDEVYAKKGTAAADTAVVPIEWKLKELFLVYESTVLDSKEDIARMSRGGMTYYVDVPRARLQKLSSGMRLTTNALDIPKGTKVLMVAWVAEHQIFYNPTEKKNLSTRLTFPRDCTNAQFLLKGHADPLIFSGGLEDVGLEKAFNSASCRAYHSLLGVGYDNAAVLDLSQRDIKENTEIEVSLMFNQASSPAGLYMFAITLQQGMYTYHKGSEMKLEILV